MAGRLKFIKEVDLPDSGSAAAIINLPDGTLRQMYTVDGTVYARNATVTATQAVNDYDGVEFSAAEPLMFTDVKAYSIKDFPQFGSYGYIMQASGVLASTIITNF